MNSPLIVTLFNAFLTPSRIASPKCTALPSAPRRHTSRRATGVGRVRGGGCSRGLTAGRFSAAKTCACPCNCREQWRPRPRRLARRGPRSVLPAVFTNTAPDTPQESPSGRPDVGAAGDQIIGPLATGTPVGEIKMRSSKSVCAKNLFW